eukprot:g6424.t1
MIIFLMFYPSVSGHALQFFRCQTIDGEPWLMADYQLPCYDQSWFSFLILVSAILSIVTVGLPVTMLVLLCKNRRKIMDEDRIEHDQHSLHPEEDVDNPLVVLYRPYKKDRYYYEVVKMTFKLSLWVVLVLFQEGDGTDKNEMQLGIALVVNVIQLSVHIYLLPLEGSKKNPDWLLNLVETFSLILTCYMNFAGFTINYLESSLQSTNTECDSEQECLKQQNLERSVNIMKVVLEIITWAQLSLLPYFDMTSHWITDIGGHYNNSDDLDDLLDEDGGGGDDDDDELSKPLLNGSVKSAGRV